MVDFLAAPNKRSCPARTLCESLYRVRWADPNITVAEEASSPLLDAAYFVGE